MAKRCVDSSATENDPCTARDFLRIAIPPAHGADHVTRCLASAYFQGMSHEDISERNVLHRLDRTISPPFVPVQPQDQEQAAMLQLQGALLPPLDDTPPFLRAKVCRGRGFAEDDPAAPEDCIEEEVPHRRAEPAAIGLTQEELLAELQAQPAAIQELFYVWLHITPPEMQDTIVISSRFLDHPRFWTCRDPRPARIDRDFTQWLCHILEEWRDRIDWSSPATVYLVRPSPQATATNPVTQPHVIVAERA